MDKQPKKLPTGERLERFGSSGNDMIVDGKQTGQPEQPKAPVKPDKPNRVK